MDGKSSDGKTSDGKSPKFYEHPKGNNPESAWSYFFKEGPHAKCKICDKILKASGGTTSGLHTHLKQIHQTNLLKRCLPKSEGSSKIASSMSTETFVQQDSLPSAFARMTASDGLSFNVISTSYDIKEGLTARGFKDVPSCPKTIRKIVVEYSHSIRSQLTKKLSEIIKNGERLCLTLDEWTSTRNRRYMNVNVHSVKEFWNLGLVRVHGSMPSEKCVDLMKEKLSKHGLSLDKHLIAITTHGAAVMVKISKLINADQQLCFAHGIHLAVQDVLYTKSRKNTGTSGQDNEDFDSDDDDDDSTDDEDAFAIDEPVRKTTCEETHDIFSLIAKVRAVVKKFRNSPVKNDSILQKYVKEEFKKELAVVLDTKIRWNSLLAMLERFCQLRSCIQKSLIDIKSDIHFTESEFDTLSNITSILLPIKLAVEAICRQDASLLTADVAIKFMFQCLKENTSTLSAEFQVALTRRIKERRSDLSSLLQYLHNQYQSSEDGSSTMKNNSSKECFDDVFSKMNKNAIVKKIVSIIDRLHKEEEDAVEPENREMKGTEQPNSSSENLSLQQRLQLALSKEIPKESLETTDERTPNSLLKIVKREILTFEELNVRGKYLRMVYDHLLTIPPSSVEAERAFSAAGILCTKIRSRMDDHTNYVF